jgi:hypothetical protein
VSRHMFQVRVPCPKRAKCSSFATGSRSPKYFPCLSGFSRKLQLPALSFGGNHIKTGR